MLDTYLYTLSLPALGLRSTLESHLTGGYGNEILFARTFATYRYPDINININSVLYESTKVPGRRGVFLTMFLPQRAPFAPP